MNKLDISNQNGFLNLRVSPLLGDKFELIHQTLKYLESDKNLKPEANLPNRESFAVFPWQYLVVGYQSSNSKADLHIKKALLKRLAKLKRVWSDLIVDVFLVGEEWLDFDENFLPKSDGDLNFIIIEEQVLKVFKKSEHLQNFFEKNELKPQSWIWRVRV